ncbi:MAG: hypothetical protein Q4D54_01515 [Eubacteriales bacterium]|nr:hypothetical protein [Lachnospiraceae bacterium]MDO5126410.1 hypothetical protein [Eubacteriales bacterium]
MDYPMKRMLVLFIKYKELMALLNCFNDPEYIAECGFDCHPKDSQDFITGLCNVLPAQYAGNLKQMTQMMRMMQMMDTTNKAAEGQQQSKNASHINLYDSVMDILNENE